MEISVKEFMLMQPNCPRVTDTDKYYLALAMRLAAMWDESRLMPDLTDAARRRVVLAVVGYYQDVVADAGLWRAFTMMHEHLYGSPLPFYGRSDNYVNYELNLDDLRFVVWYTLEGLTPHNGMLNPLDEDIARLARLFFAQLDSCYDDAPNPVEYNLITGIETGDDSDASSVYDLSRWLFFHSYLMPPAAKVTLAQKSLEAGRIAAGVCRDRDEALRNLDDRTMIGNPTGPLSLSVGQWIRLIADAELPEQLADEAAATCDEYERFVEANGGDRLVFFATYAELEEFLLGTLNRPSAGHALYPEFVNRSNFVVMAHPQKGVVVVPDAAKFICHPANACYDRLAARSEAHTLITSYGRYPMELVRRVFSMGLVPDAALPSDPTGRLLLDNWDFLARLYQQGHYNA